MTHTPWWAARAPKGRKKETMLLLKDQEIAEQNVKLAEQKARIAEQGEKLSEQTAKLAERNQQLKMSVQLLQKAGMTIEEIATNLHIAQDMVRQLIVP